jgi:hypothetical protein
MPSPLDTPRANARGRRRATWRGAAGLLVAPLLAACEQGPAREAVIVTDSAGVTIVSNDPEQALWSRETAWRLSPRPRIQIGNQPYDPDQRIYRGEHARRRSDGSVAVANRGMGDVRVFDAGGEHLASMRFQRDPTLEAGRPRRVYPLPGDTLLVYEVGEEISLWGPDFVFLRRLPLTRPDAPFVTELEGAGSFADGSILFVGRLPVDESLTGRQRSTMRLMRFGRDGRLLDSFGDFPDATEIIGEGVYAFGPEGLTAAGDSTVWYSGADGFEVREIARGGRLLRIFRIDQAPPPVTAADLSAFRVAAVRQLARNRGITDDEAEAIVDAYTYAEVFPTFSELVVDELGNVWAQIYRWFDMGGDRMWTVFGSDGRYLGEVVTPYALTVHEIGADYLLGHMSDGRGGEAVYIYGLLKPEAAPEG